MSPKARALAISLLLALIVAGGALAVHTSRESVRAQPGNSLRIGVSISLTGTYDRPAQELRNGYLLWMEQINAGGGLLGRPVEFVIYDDASEPEAAVHLYERLITEDNVNLIIGPYSSTITVPVSSFTEQLRFPMVAAGAASTEVWARGYRYVFGIYTPARRDMDGAIDIAAENGYRTVAIINESTSFPRDTAAGAEERAADANLQIVAREEYEPEVEDLRPALTRIRMLNPDVLIAGTFDEHATLIVRQLKELDWAPKILALNVGPSLPGFYEALGPDADYVFGASQWEPGIGAPGAPEFVASYAARFGYEPGYHAAVGFAGAQLLQQAIERTQSFDNERIREALAEMETSTIFGPYKVDNTGAQIAKPSYLIQWLDGERKLVWPQEVAEAEYVVPMPAWETR